MYVPDHFREDRPEVLLEFMRAHSFATLVTHGESGMTASHVPLLVRDGVIRGHLSRANPQCRDGGEALVIFQGPHHYVSPGWYPAKAETGRVVPTWNYVAVHAYGNIRFFDDATELLDLVRTLTDMHESGYEQPWSVSDAPPQYVDGLLRAIVGFEIAVTRLEGKWKLNQNRSASDRAGVVAALRDLGTPEAAAIARLISGQ